MKTITAVDLFCGAGGTSTGLIQAAEELGYKLNLTAINHWGIAIDTYKANYPWANPLQEDLDSVNPRKLFPGGYLDLLVASPECTHHSNAAGGRPKNDQSRASAWHVLRWAESINIQNILIENVKEFMDWGPLYTDCDCGKGTDVDIKLHDKKCHWQKAIKRLKGQTFLAFINALKSLDYTIDYRVINAANYGDATTRARLFIMARKNKPVEWPDITHSQNDNFGFLAKTRRWRTAKDIIDWNLKSESIFKRKKPLSPNTMRRIMHGLEKFGGAPFLAEYHSSIGRNERIRSIDVPLPTQDCSNRFAICEPYIVMMYGKSNVRAINEPLPTITSHSNHLYLCEPFIVTCNHGKDANRSYSINAPIPTITGVDAWGIAQPSWSSTTQRERP